MMVSSISSCFCCGSSVVKMASHFSLCRYEISDLLPVGVVFMLIFCNITVFRNQISLDVLKSLWLL